MPTAMTNATVPNAATAYFGHRRPPSGGALCRTAVAGPRHCFPEHRQPGEPAAYPKDKAPAVDHGCQIGHTARLLRQRHKGAHGPSVADLSLCAVGAVPSKQRHERVGAMDTLRINARRRPREKHDEPPYAIEQHRILNADPKRVPLAVRRLGYGPNE